METGVLFNFFESIFWIILSLLCGFNSLNSTNAFKKLYFTAYLLLLLFGCSDIIEMKTGAWWQPWWLLVWKAICIVGLIRTFLWYLKVKAKTCESKKNCMEK